MKMSSVEKIIPLFLGHRALSNEIQVGMSITNIGSCLGSGFKTLSFDIKDNEILISPLSDSCYQDIKGKQITQQKVGDLVVCFGWEGNYCEGEIYLKGKLVTNKSMIKNLLTRIANQNPQSLNRITSPNVFSVSFIKRKTLKHY